MSDICFALYVLFTWADGLRGHFPYAEMEVDPLRAAVPPLVMASPDWSVGDVLAGCALPSGIVTVRGPEKFEVESP